MATTITNNVAGAMCYFVMSDGKHVALWVEIGVGIRYRMSSDLGASWGGAITIAGTASAAVSTATGHIFAESVSASTIYFAFTVTPSGTAYVRGGRLTYSSGSFSGFVGTSNLTTGTFNSAAKPFGLVHLSTGVYALMQPSGDANQPYGFTLKKYTASTFGSTSTPLSSINADRTPVFLGRAGSNVLVGSHATSGGFRPVSLQEYTSSLVEQGVAQTIETGTSYTIRSVNDASNYQHIIVSNLNITYEYDAEFKPTGKTQTSASLMYYYRRSADFIVPYPLTATTAVPETQTAPTMDGDVGVVLDQGQYRVVIASASSDDNMLWKVLSDAGNPNNPTAVAVPVTRTDYKVSVARYVGGSYAPGTKAHLITQNTSWSIFAPDPIETNTGPTVALLTPINGAETFDPEIEPITFTWSVADSDDPATQSAYEISVQASSPGAAVQTSSGTTAQTVTFEQGTFTTSLTGYQWRVRAADRHNTYGPWSEYSKFFTASRPSGLGALLDEVVATNHPTIEWTYTDPDGHAQSALRIRIYTQSGTQLWDSGVLGLATPIANAAQGTHQLTYTLADDTQYVLGLQVADSTGAWSTENRVTFYTIFVDPPTPSIAVTLDGDGIATIAGASASAPTGGQSLAVAQTVHRYDPILNTYTRVDTVANAAYSVVDYGFPLNVTSHYKVVTTGASGEELSTRGPDTSFAELRWMLTCANLDPLYLDVDAFEQAPAQSLQFLEPMGRTRLVSLVFDLRGNEGTFRLFIPRDERNVTIQSLYDYANEDTCYLKSPFGHVYHVALGSPSVSYIVAGNASATIPYTEVAS